MSENAVADFKMIDLRGIEWHDDGGSRIARNWHRRLSTPSWSCGS